MPPVMISIARTRILFDKATKTAIDDGIIDDNNRLIPTSVNPILVGRIKTTSDINATNEWYSMIVGRFEIGVNPNKATTQ